MKYYAQYRGVGQGVLANDTDLDGDPLTAVLSGGQQPAHINS